MPGTDLDQSGIPPTLPSGSESRLDSGYGDGPPDTRIVEFAEDILGWLSMVGPHLWPVLKAEVERRIGLPMEGQSAMSIEARAAQTRRPYEGFDREEQVYANCKSILLRRHEGKYVVLVGEEIDGPYDTYSDALHGGFRRFGKGPLFVKKVQAEDSVTEVSRDITLCRP